MNMQTFRNESSTENTQIIKASRIIYMYNTQNSWHNFTFKYLRNYFQCRSHSSFIYRLYDESNVLSNSTGAFAASLLRLNVFGFQAKEISFV